MSGRSVSSAGDVNGDGYDDLIIGADRADPNGDSDAGETYVIYGGASAPGTNGVLDLSDLDGTNGFILNGIDAYDWSGLSVSSAGDVNGDGYDDLIIGAYGVGGNGMANYFGETYVIYGGASAPGTNGVLDLSALDGTDGFILNGIDRGDRSAYSLSSAGDVNGDGYDDLIIGAWGARPNGDSYTGETYVIYGGASAPGTGGVLDLSDLDGTDGFILNGIDAGDESGRSVSSAGDVNGDGYDDLIIGARYADPNGDSQAGETYIVYGGASAPGTEGALDLSDLDGTNGFILNGIDADDRFGRSVSSAGDVNGDGYDDLIIGAPSADPNGDNRAGETYVIYGGATGTESLTPVTAQGTAAADNFTGNAGADSFTAIATNDVVRAGAGDDRISVTALDFAAIDGGTGQDTLVLDGAGLSLDLREPGNGGVDSVEVIDLSGAGGNTLVLDALAVFDLTEERAGGIATLDVLGDANDTVVLTRDNFNFIFDRTETEAGTTWTVYRADNAEVRVATGVEVQNQVTAIDLSLLDGTNGFILNGIDADDRSGWSVSSAGDVNGDGYDDLIIGATNADPNGTDSGESYVVYGGASAPGTDGVLDLSDLDGTNGFILNGIDAGDRSGWSVSSAGDVNGDGYDDLIIGAFYANPNGDGNAGETYVIYGGASAPGTGGRLNLSTLDGTDGFILNGIDADDRSGWSVSSAGDVNGDGYDDLIIGASYADPNGDRSGETYVVYGGASASGTDGVLDLGALDGSGGFILNGIDAVDISGNSVSSAGDVNGDGYDDLIIGANGADPNGDNAAGETYVVYGGASAPGTNGVLDLSDLDGTNGFIFNGIDAGDNSGRSVSSAGDVNGDGYDDLIMGARWADPNGDNGAGETYLVYGGASAPGTNGALDLSDLDGTNGFILNGIDARDFSGFSVSSAGDINGDGYDDLIIGAYEADPGGDSDAGETYIVYGGANAPGTGGVLDLSDLDGTNGFILSGIDGGDQSGRSVSSAGDVNGDGYDDLIIGARRAGPNGNREAGESYVVYGGATGTESLTPVTAQGTAAADNFTGNAGADSFTAIATNDVVRAAAGDDRISVTALDFAAIDGGTGQDTLVLDGAGLSLDLTGAGHAGVDSVEVFDLSGTGANTLVLDALAVFDLTEERDGGIATLDVLGDADDRVELAGANSTSSGTETEDGTTYNVYQDGNAEVRVQTGVQVHIQAAPVFTSDATARVAENQTVAYEAQATDADSDPLSYSLSGTDAALFTIDPATGVVSFITAPDFENPGDAGGNNVYDITVTASDGTNSTDQTVAITVTDEYDLVPLSTLDGTNGFILNGIDAGDQSGRSVSSAGDVNGDGYDDLIIGARYADPNGDRSGETYVVYGGASAPGTGGVLDLSDLDGTNGFILNGIDSFDQSGLSVSSAGDVNGDGYDDLIIGAWGAGPNGDSQAGETYLVYGGASAPGTGGRLNLSTLDGTNGFILNGIDAGDLSGWSVSSAGDVNGDGYDDLIIGARRADPNGDVWAGETYVVYGGASAPGTGGVLDLSDLDGTNGFILNGIDRSDLSGWSVSSAGDVNGDGYDDLIIGAWGAGPNGDSQAGETYIVYGGASAPGIGGALDLSDLDGTNGFILNGIDASDSSGRSVSSAGDVNGDGYDDLIIGANGADPNGDSAAGETYIVYGGANAPGTGGVLGLSALNGTNGFILTGVDAGDLSGSSVSSAGDVNGDGYDDLIIGARNADPNGDNSAGETYVVYGGASAPGTGGVLDLSDLDGTNGFILNGIDRLDYSGSSVSSAGDVNGDGYDDLIIGAYRADPNGESSGETYVIYGGATGTESLVPVMASGTAAADNFTGNAGADSFTAIATNDVVRGGAGDDRISVTALDFAAIDGGMGQDTLVLDGAGLSLNLTRAGHAGVDSVEVFDLSGTGANTLVLDAQAVFDLTEERAGGIATLDVLGDADDTVRLAQSADQPLALTGQETEDGVTYSVYRAGNAEVRVQTGVQVQILAAPVFTSDASASVAENQTVAYEAQATDEDSDTLSYSLSGTDAALFTIDPATGVVSFITAPDFEDPDDANGDNVYDIIVTATDGANDTIQPVAITVTNVYDLEPLSTLDGTNGFILNGIDADDYSGRSVSSAGDVNGDGYDDLIIGAWQADPNGNGEAGETYIVYGGASAPGTGGRLNLSTLDGTDGFILNGIDADNRSGFSVSSAGDVNGDGYDDLIIGADRADPNRGGSGETYVVYGGASAPGTDGVLDLGALDGTNGFILNGIDAGDYSAGPSVSSAGDVNGDGYDDLIIGAFYANPNGNSDAGETYVVYGGASAPGTGGVLDLSDLDGTNGFILNGIDSFDQSGRSVSSAGDVNGDGYDDLIIGALRADPNGDDSAGETYVVYGGASAPGTDGVLDLGALDGTNGFILNGIYSADFSGNSVSSAGDVNGDGYDDLIIGALRADPNGDNSAGETYVIYGGASSPGANGVLDLSDLDGTNGFILNGIDRSDLSGNSVSSAGDVNGDGYDDLIIGASLGDPLGDPNEDRNVGETYLIYGGASAPDTGGVLDLSDLDGTNGFILNGIDAYDFSGNSVSSAGDVNGDGYDDLIIGAPSADPNGNSAAGESYVIYGGATRTESLTSVTAQGTAAADNFTGNAGADSFTAIATDDVVRGGAGDDRISVTALDFAAIDGGTGQDTLVLDGAGLSLDLTGAGHAGVDSVEVFDLSGTGANMLLLDALAVFDLTEERAGGMATLDVLGDANDTVELAGGHFTANGTATEDGTTYNVYRDGNAEVRVQTGVQVQNPAAPVFTSDASAGVAENRTVAYEAQATDADSDPLTYSLSGTDAALFTINPTTGVVSFITAPDFENPGDVGGDNVYDITVTASDGTNSVDQTVAITVTDLHELIDLSTLDGTNGFILNGIDRSDISGNSVSSAGDVNGDGYDDLIIGALSARPNGAVSGETYVIYGGASAPGTNGVLDLSDLDGTNGFILNGIDRSDLSGNSVSSAGDVNGDGYDDLIIGAYRADPNGDSRAGETYVVYGGASAPGTDGVLDLGALDGSNGFILNGIDARDYSGNSVSSAGDVNGDGYDDLIIGARSADPNGDSRSGETYVVYGGASAPGAGGMLDLSMLDGSNGFILNGIDADDRSGRSVSSAGDVNGDGYDDLIIGASSGDPNGNSNAGETYVVYGGANAPGTGGVLGLSALNGTNGFILNGIDRRDYSGNSVSSAGDVNGDGYDDLIIGALAADPNRDRSGETYIVYGGANAPGTNGALDLSDLDGTNGFILNGIDADDRSGRSVSSAGDVNGDGYDDLIIGTYEADPGGDGDAGETYLVYGGANAPGTGGVLDLSDLDGTNGFILNGIDAGDESGRSVSSAGDVNGDGYDDLIIGARRADPNGNDQAGETYVIYGGATGTESLTPVTAQGTAAADNFTGNAGDDSFTAIATNDVVRGGAGDDRISVTALDFAAIDGGTGQDTLVLDGAGLSLDLREPGNAGVDSVEVFDLSGTGANTLLLDALAVFDLTEERDGGIASLDVLGGADDRVEFRNSFTASGTATEGDTTYTVYRAGNAEVRVQTGVQVQIPAATAPVFSSDATADAAENQNLAYTAVATDADGDALSYSLSGTDAALFRIGPNTGVVNFRQAPDFENPGDAGGDNVYDIIVTASDGTNSVDQTVAITVTDLYELIDLSVLDGTNGFILNGIDAVDRSGYSVSSAGDVNGDGYDDLIIGIGARYADPNGGRSGETYVVYGGASAPGTDGVLDLSDLDGTDGFILNGIDANDFSGRSVSSAGDVNGDGYDDLIIGASGADPNGDDYAGETYVIYGGASAPGTDGVLGLSALNGTDGFILNGIDAGDGSGWSVSSAGDVNGDGYDDLIIGVVTAAPNGNGEAGETYVVYGGASAPGTNGVLDLSDLDGTDGFILNGIDAGDRSGHSVSSAGDVNGDGYDDLIIGARYADPNGDRSGETYVVYGGASAPGTGGMLDLSDLDGTNGFILNGIDAVDLSGWSVSSAGDVNGDGYDDLIIGAIGADPNVTNNAGETYVVYGGASAPGEDGVLDLSDLDGTDGFILNGIDAVDRSGWSVSSAGDVNGDGYDDLIIGAVLGDPNGDRHAGETYVVYGGASAPGTGGVLDLSDLDGTDGFILNGIDAGDESGRSVSSAGDVNGDGYDDLIIGAGSADPNGNNAAGESYVIYGGATGTESLTPVTAQGTAAADNFTGNAGADSFTAIATNDVVRGAAGDDRISVTALDFVAIDGGTGQDTLVLDGAGLSLNLTRAGHAGVDSVEVFDLSGTGANTLVLDAQAVFDLTEERAGGIATLDVLGDADDTVRLAQSADQPLALTGQETEDGVTYSVYRAGNAEVRVQTGVQVQNPVAPVFTSDASAGVAENQTVAYEAQATDEDSDTLSYSLSGTDAALFTIDPATGVVSFITAPDFEDPDDANGDNVYDIIVTATDGANDTTQPVAITVTNVYDLVPLFSLFSLSALDGTNGFILNGIDFDDRSGQSVSSAGDVNGDGYDDLIIGARNADPNGDSGAGETYVIYGGASAPGTGGGFNLSTLDGTNGFILTGIGSLDRSGGSVSSAGDINGDGYDDLIIGANQADPNRSYSGETYVVYGGASAPGTGGVLDLSDLDGTNGFILNGIDAFDYSGRSVSSAGDVNGDGYDDLIIGADRADPNVTNNAGETYVVYGGASAPGTDGVLDLSMLNGSNGFILNGIDVYDQSGRSVSSAGDVNGDGYDDLIIGARYAGPDGDMSGETYVVYGGASAPGTGGVLDLSDLDGTNGFILNGIDVYDQSGRSVSSAGDVNGDGYDDLIIGARNAGPDGDMSGETYVVYGGASAPGTGGRFNLSTLNGTNGFILNGIDAVDLSGWSVSSAGDVNGDGYDDLIIGAIGADPNVTNNAGETYVVYGGASAPGEDGVLDLSDLDGTDGFILNGIDAVDRSGWSVSSAGDVNGDGYDDLIIGAYRADPNGNSAAGESYVIYGGATGTESLTPVTAQGTAAADNFTGNAGADSFTAIATNDVVRGGAGDDRISVTALDFAAIDGGTGQDTLVLAGADLSLDLREPGNGGVDSVEVIDLSGSGGNRLLLDALAVFDLTEERADGMATLDVLGDGDDTVVLARDNFIFDRTETEAGTTWTVYRADNAEVRVATGVEVQNQAAAIDLSLLDGGNGFTLNGIDAGDTSGIAVSSAGDVNGDGYDDLIIGANGADPNGADSGETYVVYGGAAAPGTDGALDLSMLDGGNGFTLTGVGAEDRSGRSVSAAGDVNGDGYGDLIIGAFRTDPNGESSGATYVVYGGAVAPGAGGVLALSDLDGGNGFTLNGIEMDDRSGFSVSSAGDVNGDGYDDLIIGANGADPNGADSGATYVVYGAAVAPGTDGILELSALDGGNGFILNGIDANDYSGRSVSSAGDVNGDGYDDLIIGAWQADPNVSGSGETYVIYGGARAPGTAGMLDLSALNGGNGFILNGIDAYSQSGISVSSAGDVNGDGYDDLIIGAYRGDRTGPDGMPLIDVGQTYVVYGGASAPGTAGMLDLAMLDGANGFSLSGIDMNDRSGFSVSSAGDVNGDGYDDLIIGADLADPNGGSSGETYVIYGGAAAPGMAGVLDLATLNGTEGFVLNGIDAEDRSGRAVASAGDVNGDGYDDLIIGAWRADRTGPAGMALAVDAGETYLVYGGATATESTAPITAQGTDAADNFSGNAGADSFTEIATADVVRGGAGDDTVSVTALDFADIDGGTGRDTLVLAGADLSLDLREPGNAGVDSVEVFDLSGADGNTLVLDAQAVFDLTEERAGGIATLDVLGDANDRVELAGANSTSSGTETEDGTTYNVYQDGNAEVRVQTGVQVQILAAPVFTSDASARVAENQTVAYEAQATDADGDTLSYSLSGTDAALFTIDPTTGVVSFITAPDFENPGDAGGDNVYDITVTASDGTNSTDQTVAITVTDGYDPVPLSTLDGTNGFILNGIDMADRSGFSVSSAGDVNGDGYDDLIIGARSADPNGDNAAGETYVVYGGASAPGTSGVLDLSDLDGTNGFILNGIDAVDLSGWSVSSAGDVNGDGYDDLIIGARYADPNEDDSAGETYVVYGGASAPGTGGRLNLSTLDGTDGFILNGIDVADRSGFSVSSAGDVNGDGYDDLIIGARSADPNGDNAAGETYVVYGGASAPGTNGVLDLSDLDGTSGFILNGIDANDRSGYSVSSAGDVNGDGYDDLIIGADRGDPNGDNAAGETYVVYGGASAPGTDGVLDLSMLNGSNGFILNGIDANDRSGASVSSAGDVNGDGYDDLIIGALSADPNGNSQAGETYIVYGGANAPGAGGVLDLGALNGTNGFILTGIDAYDQSGQSVSSAGDVNGDGYDDLIIGANTADPKGDNAAGETYIVYGGASAPGTGGVLDLSALDGTNGFILTGIDAVDRSGISVSSAGDVNGDGYDDLIIGAHRADPDGDNDAGETYVIYGGAMGTESLTPVTAQGTAAADNFTGNAGADSFTAIATNDVVRGGAGDDRISVTALDFAAIDGGTGQDTLVLDGAGLSLDLRGAGNAGVDSVEVFDLSGTGADTLMLAALAVFDLTEERAGGIATLDVLGDANDRVELRDSNFTLNRTVTEDGTTYNVYRDGNAEVRVQDGVAVTPGTMSSSLLSGDPDPAATAVSPAPDLSRLDALVVTGDTGVYQLRKDGDLMDSFTEWMDNGPRNDQWHDRWHDQRGGLWDGSFQADGFNSLDKPDSHRLNQEPVFEDLSVRDSIPDTQDTGEDAVLMSLPVPALTPMAQPVFAGDKSLHNDLALILRDMEIFADPVKHGDTDMDGF